MSWSTWTPKTIQNSLIVDLHTYTPSRASQDAQIFTNDANALEEKSSRDISKTSEISFIDSAGQALAERQTQIPKDTSALGLGLGL